jgi:hypothetical protein
MKSSTAFGQYCIRLTLGDGIGFKSERLLSGTTMRCMRCNNGEEICYRVTQAECCEK